MKAHENKKLLEERPTYPVRQLKIVVFRTFYQLMSYVFKLEFKGIIPNQLLFFAY